MTRHVLRQFAVQTLYQMEVGQMSKEEAIENVKVMVEGLKEEAMGLVAEEVTPHQILEIERQFTLEDFYFELVDGVLTHQQAIDQLIEENLKGWSFSRLNKVDRAILRLAAYEMKFSQETPHKIIIDEAVELTKEFSDTGDGKARSFNNKVLDQMSKRLA